jgi:glycosyltransferase involved in cell wall biosynthesis
MNAGPWLPVPPPDYGGIENVVATLVPELRARGHRVVLATVGESDLPADEVVSVFPRGRFPDIAGPYNEMMGIAHAHMRAVLDRLRQGDVDLVHDHLEVVGPALYAAAGDAVPPVLQTLHWDLAKHPDFYASFDGRGRVFFAGVSESQLARGHPTLRAQALGAVPLATPLPAGDPVAAAGYLLTLGRFTPVKGYDLAARAARRLGVPLVMAGPVAGYPDAAALAAALADPAGPAAQLRDVRYFRDEVEPHVDGGTVRWIGSVGGPAKDELVRSARAVLFPVRWDEPGGTAVVEALSAGVPVVAMRRGVMGELVDHGVTGWLADTEEEFVGYLSRVDELDRLACREVAARRFSPAAMATRYEALYRRVLSRAGRPGGRARAHGVHGMHGAPVAGGTTAGRTAG